MRSKEFFIVVAAVLLLANLSVGTTLYLAGFFGEDDELVAEASTDSGAEEGEEGEEGEGVKKAPPPPPPKEDYFFSMTKAMNACEERLQSTNKDVHKSFSFDTTSSYYAAEDLMYFVFIDLVVMGTAEKPGEDLRIYCQVSSVDGKISTYKALPAHG